MEACRLTRCCGWRQDGSALDSGGGGQGNGQVWIHRARTGGRADRITDGLGRGGKRRTKDDSRVVDDGVMSCSGEGAG